ncbi:MAG: glycosyltransferase family 4 protein [bacterium]
MRTVFYHTASHWSGTSRAVAVAARGLAAQGAAVTVVCRAGSSPEEGFRSEGLDVVAVPPTGSIGPDAWRLRAVLKEKFIEVVFLHTEREHLVASSAMRLAERGAVIRRVPPGGSATSTRSGDFAGKMATSLLLFTTEADRARSVAGDKAFVAPLGVDVAKVQDVRAASRETLGYTDATQLIVCVIDRNSGSRVTTAMRTLALLAERHPALRLALVGRAEDADDTRMHAAALGVTSLVRFLRERDQTPELLAAADVGWVAADGDDGALACLDFMAARVPVIAERTPLVSTYVPDGIAGVLLPPADPSDTASAVARFLGDAETRKAMGNAGFTRAKRDFGESAMIAGFVAAAAAAGDRTLWAAR